MSRPPDWMCAMIDMNVATYSRRLCMRSIVLAVVLAGLATTGASPAVGQEAASRRLEDSFPPEYAAQVREIARNARDAGVPPALIARKAFEGVAKGYPPERIVTALDAYAGRLREASRLMGPDTRPAGLAAAAEALRRGVPPDAIRSMAGRRGEGRDLRFR